MWLLHSRPPTVREFIAPLPLLAVALLGVNDHLLKATFHNALTGKLSDLAGCFFLPLYLSALLSLLTALSGRARLLASALVTAALFTAIKLSATAAAAVARALEVPGAVLGYPRMHIVADPTDLIALPLVALAVAYGLRCQRREAPCAVSPSPS